MGHGVLVTQLERTEASLRTVEAMRHRADLARARHDVRDRVVKRSERTRHLIELGGLVAKSGLVELTDDDRATLYGAFLNAAIMPRGGRRNEALALWRRRGKREFDFTSRTERQT